MFTFFFYFILDWEILQCLQDCMANEYKKIGENISIFCGFILFLLVMLAEVQSLRYTCTRIEYEPDVGENFGKDLTFVQFNTRQSFWLLWEQGLAAVKCFYLKPFKREWNQFPADCSQMHQNRYYLWPFQSLTSLLRAPMSACLFGTTLNSPMSQGRLEKNLHYFREPYT